MTTLAHDTLPFLPLPPVQLLLGFRHYIIFLIITFPNHDMLDSLHLRPEAEGQVQIANVP